ncbi:Phospholipase C [Variovorax sp. SRS16]|uniref:alkaline phosphatase family protein n=1 Tax=Variovorax sp. SRS16 TaxID=282217 RepID=UPI001317EFA8|nr:alkaline phosphatase family protein [Variovorax sp. SRS16]VTU31481.1 Phospholipase C [Variovorax sp. SRS16]
MPTMPSKGRLTSRRAANALLSCAVLGAIAWTATGCSNSGPIENRGGIPVAPKQQSIRHVFVITMENKSFKDTFGTSKQAPDLQAMAKQGALLTQYYGTGHVSLDNYVAMMSGQPSTKETQSDCVQGFNDVVADGWDAANPKVLKAKNGMGCVYPKEVKTFVNQLDEVRLTWKGYMGDMGNDPTREAATCGHPKIGAIDNTHSAQAPTADVPQGDQYATRHNPFMYFHSIIDDQAYCNSHDVNLEANLQKDLRSIDTTPNFAFITPNLCDDGHDGDGTGAQPCANGDKGGLTSVNAFLKKWVPIIQASPAYQKDGLVIINFDESADMVPAGKSESGGVTTITLNLPGESCCGQQVGPNVKRPDDAIIPVSAKLAYKLHYQGVGGDRTGALLLSKFIKPGTVSETPYNHYSLLKSLENIFQTREYLGYADNKNLAPFDSDVFINLQ